MRETGKSLNNSIFICSRSFNVIWRLDPDKTRGHYQIGIRLINLCDKVLCKPLYTVFPSCMRSGIFPTEWEIANVAPIHRRDAKKVSKVIDLYLCQHLGKNLNASFTIIIFLETTSYPQISLVLNKVSLALTHLSPMHPFSTSWKYYKASMFCDVFRW